MSIHQDPHRLNQEDSEDFLISPSWIDKLDLTTRPRGLRRFCEALDELQWLPRGYSGLAAETGFSSARTHGYVADLEALGVLRVETGVGSENPSERRPSHFHWNVPEKREASAQGRKVYTTTRLVVKDLREGFSVDNYCREILSRIAQLLDPNEDRFGEDALGYSGFLMARASFLRGHPEVGPGAWASWAGVSRRTGTTVVGKMVDQGLATKVAYGRYLCTLKVMMFGSEWDAVMALAEETRSVEIIDLLDHCDIVEKRRSRRKDAAIRAALANKAQTPKPPTPNFRPLCPSPTPRFRRLVDTMEQRGPRLPPNRSRRAQPPK